MKRNDRYILRNIAGTPYLVPIGQMAADYHPYMQVNHTSVLLWNFLKEDISKEALFAKMQAAFEATDQEFCAMKKELENFLAVLLAKGLIEEDISTAISGVCHRYYEIAGIGIELTAPAGCFPAALEDFLSDAALPSKIMQYIELRIHAPHARANGSVLIRNEQLCVMEQQDCYIILFPAMPNIEELRLSKDGTAATFYSIPPYDCRFHEDFFHALRLVFLYLAQKQGMFALHSASVLYQKKAWLFSGKSQTGKSTHTNLWNSLFKTPVINGDLNLISIHHGMPMVYGIPWCGTSGIYSRNAYPLGGITLLKQAPEEYFIPLSAQDKAIFVMQRLISPVWDEAMLDCTLAFVQALTMEVPVWRFACTKEISAAATMKTAIDSITVPE